AGVELPELRQGHPVYPADAIRRTVDRGVVDHHALAIGRGMHVQLDHIGVPVVDRLLERGERVLRREPRPASMRYQERRACQYRMRHTEFICFIACSIGVVYSPGAEAGSTPPYRRQDTRPSPAEQSPPGPVAALRGTPPPTGTRLAPRPGPSL